MKIVIVSGSHRKESESDRVAQYVARELESAGATTEVVSLGKHPLPMWDEGVWAGDPKWRDTWGPISLSLRSADGFVIVSPEWSGMVPAALKNFFLLCSSQDLGHKPALLVGVSSGVGGSYPIAELRTSSYKNTRIVYIPDHVIIRTVGEMLHGDEPASEHDKHVRGRIRYSVAVLMEYAKALALVRASSVVDYKEFPYGM